MSYNWEKIFKNKTDKELYEIFIGNKQLNKKAQEFAKSELVTRNFNFNNIEKHQKKWTLEKLIEDERNEKGTYNFISWSSNSKHYLFMSIFGGAITILMTLDYFFEFLNNPENNNDPIEQVGFIIFFFVFFIIGIVSYRKKRIQERNRKIRIKELIKEI